MPQGRDVEPYPMLRCVVFHNLPNKKSAGRRHRSPRKILTGGLAVALSLALACVTVAEETHHGSPTAITVILVRHAEAGDDDPRNPHLSIAGQARAQELARVLQDVAITHLYASEYHRTQDTLAPLADRRGIRVQEHLAREPISLILALRSLPDSAVAIVAGHSNTVPDLVRRLGGNPSGLEEHPQHGWLLPHDEYSRMFIVTLRRPPGVRYPAAAKEPRDPANKECDTSVPAEYSGCLELRYGAP